MKPALPIDYLILEQDHYRAMDEIESIKTSRNAFATRFSGISWG
ncbi:MAG: hypothetical protein R2845_09025 [Thermomicrobiales bacterium]